MFLDWGEPMLDKKPDLLLGIELSAMGPYLHLLDEEPVWDMRGITSENRSFTEEQNIIMEAALKPM